MAGGKKFLKLRAAKAKYAFKYEGAGVPQGQVGKYYPAEDVVAKKGPVPVRNPPRVRSSVTPGTVLILLGGRFRGKRVVCLKTLSSGLILVSGPYSVNGVPLKRVNQKYVIATSTNVPLDGVDVSNIDDDFFAREARPKKVGEEGFFDGADARGTVTSPARKDAQNKVDSALSANIKKVAMLEAYLQAKFTLSNNDKPHLMKF